MNCRSRLIPSLVLMLVLSACNVVQADIRKIINEDESYTPTTIENINYPSGNGGAIYNEGTVILNNSHINDNSARNGGGIYSTNTIKKIENSEFKNNSTNPEYQIVKDMKEGWTYDTETHELKGIVNNKEITMYYDLPNDSVNEIYYNNELVGTIYINGKGGAIYNNGGNFGEINNSTFENNSAYLGGAIYNKNADLNITNSHFNNNHATSSNTPQKGGGAIYNLDSEINIKNSEFKNNTAVKQVERIHEYIYDNNGYSLTQTTYDGVGGAINTNKSLTIEDSTFENNHAGSWGGAIAIEKYYGISDEEGNLEEGNEKAILTIKNSQFINNNTLHEFRTEGTYVKDGNTYNIDVNTISSSSTDTGIDSMTDHGYGGAISAYNTDIIINDSTFSGNTATDGGAINSGNNENLIISNSLFINNSAKWHKVGADLNWQSYYGENKEGIKLRQYDEYHGGGGAIEGAGGNTNITGSEFRENIAGGYGGGAINYSIEKNFEIDDTEFISNNATGNGGALKLIHEGYYTDSPEVNIQNSTFSSNESTEGTGGAIYYYAAKYPTYDDNMNLINETKDFTFNVENTTFENNSAPNGAGAIHVQQSYPYNRSEYDTINNQAKITTNITDSTFTGNSGKVASAIYSEDNLNITNSEFKNNTSTNNNGAAVVVGYDAMSEVEKLNNQIEELFETPSPFRDSTHGEVISALPIGEREVLPEVNIEDSTFDNNTGGGIAVYLAQKATISNSEFKNNTTTGTGGAVEIIRTPSAQITDTNFKNNTAKKGGAIYYSGVPVYHEQEPIENTQQEPDVSGYSAGYGYTHGTASIYTGFEELTEGNLNILAKDKDIEFSGNQAEQGADIYLRSSTLNLNASQNRKISFEGGISGVNSIINVNDPNVYENLNSTGEIVINNFVSNDTDVAEHYPEFEQTMTVNVKGGKLSLGNDSYLDGTDLTIEENATLNLANNNVGTMALKSFTSNNGNVLIDVDLANTNQKFDVINVTGESSGTLNLNGVVVLSDLPDNTNSLTVDLGEFGMPDTISLNTNEEGTSAIINNNLYTIKSQNNIISVERFTGGNPGGTEPGGIEPGGTEPGGTEPGGTEPGGTEPGGTEPGGTEPGGTEPGGIEPGGTEPGGTEPGGTEPGGTEPGGTEPGGTEPGGTEPGGTEPGGTEPGGNEPAVQIDGFTVAINQNDSIDGTPMNLSNVRTYTATEDINIEGNTDRGWTGDLGGEALIVNGHGHTLHGYDKQGIVINEGQTLIFNDTNISGFKTSSDRKGALTVSGGGHLHINAVNNNVTLGNVSAGTDSNTDVVYLDDDTSQATFSTTHGKSITVNNDIRSNNQSNNLHLVGSGKIRFNGIVDPVTITNENEDTVHNDYLDDVVYNLNSGTVSVTRDEYLNGIDNKNTLNFNGGNLNIANGEIVPIDLAALNVNNTSNIMVDADLINEKMDTLTADSITFADDAYLNVSKINLLNDAAKDKTIINFVNPALRTDDDESVAGRVTTTVSEVAYSPVYKYGVGYDKESGDFTFSRAKNNDYNNLNPAVMVSPVAAQMGGYLGMLDTYSNAFNNMDMYMMTPSSMRLAQKNANKYAINDMAGINYKENSGSGIWFRPFTSYDSVRLKHGPSVRNFSYGTFLGGDTGLHDFGRGLAGQFSAHVSYLGSHQRFSSNSIYQNGGNIGFTGTLYKGNFFTGLNVNVGISVADASTMYGSEDFPVFTTGVASKTGYNLEFKDGRFIIQPSVLLSYTFVDTFKYTNAAKVKMDSDPLHAFQIAPNLKFIANTKNGWQPYLTAGMNWNIMNHSHYHANDVQLPDLSVKPFVQYGLGVQKTMGEQLTAFLQVLVRNGGRNGFVATGGLKYFFDRSRKNKDNSRV